MLPSLNKGITYLLYLHKTSFHDKYLKFWKNDDSKVFVLRISNFVHEISDRNDAKESRRRHQFYCNVKVLAYTKCSKPFSNIFNIMYMYMFVDFVCMYVCMCYIAFNPVPLFMKFPIATTPKSHVDVINFTATSKFSRTLNAPNHLGHNVRKCTFGHFLSMRKTKLA